MLATKLAIRRHKIQGTLKLLDARSMLISYRLLLMWKSLLLTSGTQTLVSSFRLICGLWGPNIPIRPGLLLLALSRLTFLSILSSI